MTSLRINADWNSELSKALLALKERVRQLPEDKQPNFLVLMENVDTLANTQPRLISLSRLNEWWTGSRIELQWSLIHEAELQLLAIAPLPVMQDLFEIVVEHSQTLPSTDTARLRLIDFINHRMNGPLSNEDIGAAI